MKTMKKALALVMALAMVLALSTTVFAVDGVATDDNGSITITTTEKGTTYHIYRIFDLASFSDNDPSNSATGNYVYKLRQVNTSLTGDDLAADQAKVDAWKAFISSTEINGVYVTYETEGEYVTWRQGASPADFAAKAIAYAKANNIATDGTQAAETAIADGYSASFTGLRLGYYLIDSTQGTLCNLTTTNPSVTIADKNKPQTQNKWVQEDSSNTFGKENTVDLTQVINFQSKVNVNPGATNVVYHDTMSDGLTYQEGSILVYLGAFTDNNLLTLGTHYTVNETATTHDHNGVSSECTFTVTFDDAYLATLVSATEFTIAYQAKLNENAVVAVPETNESIVSWGEDNWTEKSETETTTWGFSLYKYAASSSSSSSSALADAHFVLQNNGASAYNGKYAIWTPAVDAEGAVIANVYNFVEWIDLPADKTAEEYQETLTDGTKLVLVTDATGTITMNGLDSDAYNLIETQAPKGYEKYTDPIKVTIDSEGVVSQSNAAISGPVMVPNTPGALLPSTGGSGVYFYYILGAILMLGAGVLLVTKRRMSVN